MVDWRSLQGLGTVGYCWRLETSFRAGDSAAGGGHCVVGVEGSQGAWGYCKGFRDTAGNYGRLGALWEAL